MKKLRTLFGLGLLITIIWGTKVNAAETIYTDKIELDESNMEYIMNSIYDGPLKEGEHYLKH